MKLAFRKTNAPGLFPGLFNRYTRWSLKTAYAHGGLLIHGQLWHTTRKGFVPEAFTAPSHEWDVFETLVSDELAFERVAHYEGAGYDAFSLLGFKIPLPFSDSKRLNCFEAQWLGLTGINPRTPISPDTLMSEVLRTLNEKSVSLHTATLTDNDAHRDSKYPAGGAS